MAVDAILRHGDFWDASTAYLLRQANHVITDMPYDMPESPAVIPDLMTTPGNLLVFTNPDRRVPIPDERLYWVKPQRTMNYKKRCGRFVETIFVYRNDNTFNELYWQQMTGVFFDLLEDKPEHPHQKPLSLMRRLVRIYTNPGDVVFDPFMGYGTTGLACILEGRGFIGLDKDASWVAKTKTRLERSGYWGDL